MKINEVEQLVGITKKNIRFYEEQGLVCPGRDKSNGYREYSQEDVQLLLKIKLLRRLAFPIEEIRKLLEGRLTLSDCIERHLIFLNHEEHNLELIGDICRQLSDEGATLDGLPAEKYLDKLAELEKGGVRFVNVSRTDVEKKKKRGARTAAIVMIILAAIYDGVIIYAGVVEGMPLMVMLLLVIMPTAVIIGVVIALRERLKEIEGGEEDEASNY